MKNNKGITLVELLIVIVILGIIAAVSIPAVGGIVENAQKDALLADATNLRSQANLYCQQNRNEDECDGTTGFTNATGTWANDWPSLDEFIDLTDGVYAVWLEGETWQVAIYTGDYSFNNNPRNASRALVADDDDAWEEDDDDMEDPAVKNPFDPNDD